MNESNTVLRWIQIPAGERANMAFAWVEVDLETGNQLLRAWITENEDGDYAGMYIHGQKAEVTRIHETSEECKAACVNGWERLYKKLLADSRTPFGAREAT